MLIPGSYLINRRLKYPLLTIIIAVFYILSSPLSAAGEGLSGYAEFTNAFTQSKSSLGGVENENIESLSFLQRYNLTFDRTIYPLLRVTAGGIFEKNMTDMTLNGVDSEADTTQISPYAILGIGGNPLSGSVGYSRNEVTTSGSGSSKITDILETYTGRVGLRPEGLPTFDLLLSRSDSYDSARVTHNTTSDYLSVSSRYQPNANLSLLYSGSLIDTEDRLSGQKTQVLNNAFRGDYTNQFFNRRTNLFSSLTLSHQSSKVKAGSGSVFASTLTRQAAYFALDDTPDSNLGEPWTSTPSLIDNDRITPVSGINLGIPPVVGGDARPRNIGLDLGVSDAETDVLRLYYRVGVSGTLQQLPTTLVNQYFDVPRWEVYTSTDNENWVLQPSAVQSVTVVTEVDPMLLPPLNLVTRFELQLSSTLTSRYVKVVVPPLPSSASAPGIDIDNILVTEIEALVRTATAGSPEQKHSTFSGFLDSVIRTKIVDRPGVPRVLHDLTFNYNFSMPDSGDTTSSWLVSNGLSAFHTFNRYLTGNARLSWEETGQSGQDGRSTYNWSGSLQAVPLSTLRHTFVYSGRYSTSGDDNSISNSIYIANSAILYRGLSASLNGGISFSTNEAGRENQSTYFTAGINAVPHRTLTFNLGYNETHSKISGGGLPSGKNFTRTGELSASYNPISAVFLFASIGFKSETDRDTRVTQNFGGGWSPFRDGSLQLTTSYNEALSSESDERVRTFSSSLRWNIRSGWWLETTYAFQKEEETYSGGKSKTDMDSVISSLRIAF